MKRFLWLLFVLALFGCGEAPKATKQALQSPPTVKMPGSNPPAVPPPATKSGAFE
jgi:hypothetical protein